MLARNKGALRKPDDEKTGGASGIRPQWHRCVHDDEYQSEGTHGQKRPIWMAFSPAKNLELAGCQLDRQGSGIGHCCFWLGGPFEALTAAYKNAMSSSSSTGWMHRLAPLWTQVGASLLEFWRPLIDRRILIPKNLLAFGSWIFALHRPDAHNLPSSSRTVVHARKHQARALARM